MIRLRTLFSVVSVILLLSSGFPSKVPSMNEVLAAAEKETKYVRILVIPFTNSTGEEQYEILGQGFADLLMTHISQYPEIGLVQRDHLQQILSEQEIQLQGHLSEDQSIKVGQLAGADKIITGGFSLSNSQLTIQTHVFDVETTKLITSKEITGPIGNIAALGDQLAAIIVEAMQGKEVVPSPISIDQRPNVTLHFIRGLGYYYGNLYDHAVTEFMEASNLDPHYAEARFWIGRSYFADQAYGHAKIEFEKFMIEYPDHSLMSEVKSSLLSISEQKQ